MVLQSKALNGDLKALLHLTNLAIRFSTGQQQALARELAPDDQAILAALVEEVLSQNQGEPALLDPFSNISNSENDGHE
jgi:hypothetical protein